MSFDSAQNPEPAQGADPDPAGLAAGSTRSGQRPAEVEETTDLLAPSAPSADSAADSAADCDAGAVARPYGRSRLLAGVLGRSWLWFIAGCLAVTLVPILFGWRPYVVESGSMQPRITIGDVVLAAPVSDRAQVLGRVIVFDSPSKKGEVVTHRVIRFAGPQLVTKGDANQIADTARITMKDVRGLGRLLVRWVGLPLIWLQTKQWGLLLLFIASLWLAGLAVMRDQEEDDDLESASDDDRDDDSPAVSSGPSNASTGSTRSSVTLAASRRFPWIHQQSGAPAPLQRALTRGLGRLRRPDLVLRATLVVTCVLLLAVPSAYAAFAATTASTANTWTSGAYATGYSGSSTPVLLTSSTNNVTVNYPPGTAAGDLVLLVLVNGSSQTSTVASTGWTLIAKPNLGGANMELDAWWHTAGAETSVTFSSVHTSAAGAGIWVLDYKNVTSPATAGISSGTVNSASTVTPANLTTTSANTLIVSLVGINAANTLALSTQRGFGQEIVPASTLVALGVADELSTTLGTVTPPTWTETTSASQWAYITVAFT